MKLWKKINQWIGRADFGRLVKRMVIVSVILALAGGILSAVLLRPQISQALALERNDAQWEGRDDGPWNEKNRDDWEDLIGLDQITEPSRSVKITLGAVGCVFLLLALVWWLLMAAWVRKAARSSHMNAILWPLLSLVLPGAALLVFLVVRAFLRQKCPGSGQWQEKRPYCGHCGTAMARECPACGASCRLDESFCPACGASLEAQGPQRPAEGADTDAGN